MSKLRSLLVLETKLILRNRRTKTLFFLAFGMICFFPILFIGKNAPPLFKVPEMKSLIWLFHVYYLGLVMILYGQYTLSWESSYSNLLFTINFKSNEFLRTKFFAFGLLSLLSFFIILPIYFLFGADFLDYAFVVAALFYNLGINSFLLLFFSKFNTKYVDFYDNGVMSSDLVTIYNLVLTFVTSGVPYFVYVLLDILLASTYHICLLFILLGSVGLLFQKRVLRFISHHVIASKYNLLEAYTRNDG